MPVLAAILPTGFMPVAPQLSGVFVTHEPVRSPRDHVGLALRDDPKAAGTGVVFDRPPGWNLTHMPTAVEGLFVRVVGIKDGPRVAH